MLFTVERSGKSFDDALIVAQEVATGRRHVLIEGGTTGRYVPPGYLVYGRASTLLVAPFDLAALEITGPSVPLLEGVAIDIGLGVAQFDVSTQRSPGLRPGGRDPRRTRPRVRGSAREAVSTISSGRPYNLAKLSPDGRRIATELTGANNDIWTYEIASGALSRLTFEAENQFPVWSPDGKRILIQSDRGSPGVFNLFSLPADGGVAERLTTSAHSQWPTGVSPDGGLVAFTQANSRSDADIWILPLEGERTARVFVQSPFWEDGASFSPDGRFLAYDSDESGRPEVYVQAFPAPGWRRQVSADGGRLPVWSRDGREIYFRNGDKVMAARVLRVRSSPPRRRRSSLPPHSCSPGTTSGGTAASSWSSGARKRGSSRQINLVLDWPALLMREKGAPP